MHNSGLAAVVAALMAGACAPASTTPIPAGASAHAFPGFAGIGTPLGASATGPWNIDVAPDGRGLPPGSGDVRTGALVFAQKCAACHGAHGEGLIGDPLVGGRGTLQSAAPKRTVGSYWPYATTLFDYIRRAMPYNAPQSLSADEVYAVSAWILNRNGIVPDDARLDARTLAALRMPNRDGFVPDPRPGKL